MGATLLIFPRVDLSDADRRDCDRPFRQRADVIEHLDRLPPFDRHVRAPGCRVGYDEIVAADHVEFDDDPIRRFDLPRYRRLYGYSQLELQIRNSHGGRSNRPRCHVGRVGLHERAAADCLECLAGQIRRASRAPHFEHAFFWCCSP